MRPRQLLRGRGVAAIPFGPITRQRADLRASVVASWSVIPWAR